MTGLVPLVQPTAAISEASTAIPSESESTAEMPIQDEEKQEITPAELEQHRVQMSAETKEGLTVALEKTERDEIIYPSGLELGAISLALCLGVFLVALVSTGQPYSGYFLRIP